MNFKRTYNDDDYIYSVDMMLAYVNMHTPPVTTISLDTLVPQLEDKVWGNGSISPMSVLKKIDAKKYAPIVSQIHGAELKYPILMHNGYIIDGFHRLSKAYLTGKKIIHAHVFDTSLMKKFILDKIEHREKVWNLTTHELIELYTYRFCKK